MDKPWKVILAFVGVFMAGAVFGGLFTLRASGKRLTDDPAINRPVEPTPAVNPTAETRPAETTPVAQTPATQPAPPTAGQPPPPAPPNRIAPALMNQFTKRLSPTVEQKKKIRQVVDRAAEDFQRLQREHLQDTTRVSVRMYEDVAALLSPEQRTQLETMRQEMLERVRKEREKQTKGGGVRSNAQNPAAKPNKMQGP